MRSENETSIEQERNQLGEAMTKAEHEYATLEGAGLPTEEVEAEMEKLSRRLIEIDPMTDFKRREIMDKKGEEDFKNLTKKLKGQ
jgi:hypothetical protein